VAISWLLFTLSTIGERSACGTIFVVCLRWPLMEPTELDAEVPGSLRPPRRKTAPKFARLELFGVDEALRPLADWLCCLPPRREPAFSSRSAAQTERRSSSEEIEEAVEFPPLPPPVVLLETLPERLLRRSVEEDLPCLSRCRLLGGVPL